MNPPSGHVPLAQSIAVQSRAVGQLRAEVGQLGIAVGHQLLAARPEERPAGPWPAAVFGAALLAATALAAPTAALVPLVACAWLTAAVLAVEPTN